MVWPLKSPRDRNGAELKATKSNALLRYWRKSSLIIQIWDHDRFNIDQFLGEVKIPLCELTSTSKNPELTDGSCHEPTTISGWFELKARTPRDRVKGSILIRVTLFPSSKVAQQKVPHHQATHTQVKLWIPTEILMRPVTIQLLCFLAIPWTFGGT